MLTWISGIEILEINVIRSTYFLRNSEPLLEYIMQKCDMLQHIIFVCIEIVVFQIMQWNISEIK